MTYTLPENIMQAIVGTLNQMPAMQSRAILNAIEAECAKQDKARPPSSSHRTVAPQRSRLER